MTHRSLQPLDQAERDALIADNLEYAHALTAQIKSSLPEHIDFDELLASAKQGLVEAASRFDPTRQVAFTTFAYYRVRGAVYDGLRRNGWLNRSEHARFEAAANDLLENLNRRSASTDAAGADTAGDIEGELQDLANILDDVATIFVTSLDAGPGSEVADRAPDSVQLIEQGQTRQEVRLAVKSLPKRERRLVEYHYFKGLSLKDAGAKLGLSKSWASRLHARAVRLLTEALSP